MSTRDRIDPASLAGLDAMLAALPGGLNAIADIVERRAVSEGLAAAAAALLPPREDVTREDVSVPGHAGAPDVPVRVYRPTSATGPLPAVVLAHGGGMLFGSIDTEDDVATSVCADVGVVVVSVGYRLAPEHPYPAGLDDCYAALAWLAEGAAALGVDPARLAVMGGSAGGGLALGLALLARDRGGPPLRFVLASYPMLDDRNETPSSHEILDLGVWDRDTNVQAWGWYLGGASADAYAAPARADDLSGLPPTFIDVGTVDLFRDEDVAFVARLLQAGVPTEFHVYPGAFHASEKFAPDAALSQRIRALRIDALRRALHPSAG